MFRRQTSSPDRVRRDVLPENGDVNLLDSRMDRAFRLCTARFPSERERETLNDLYHRQFERHARDGASASRADEYAWQSVATVLLNLHETITKD